MELEIDMYLRKALIDHMMAEEPKECCGLISAKDLYIPVANVSKSAEYEFEMTPEDSFRLVNDPDILGYFHTHPSGMMCASKHDMETQAQVNKPSVIGARHPTSKHIEIFQIGNHLLDMPIDGMQFRYNSYDCYELVRRYYFQNRNVILMVLPRHPMYWMTDDAEDLISSYFPANGFEEFDPKQVAPEVGDVILYQTDGSRVMNHCAVYAGNNCILHHRSGRKSGLSPMTLYQSAGYLRKWLRHKDSSNAE